MPYIKFNRVPGSNVRAFTIKNVGSGERIRFEVGVPRDVSDADLERLKQTHEGRFEVVTIPKGETEIKKVPQQGIVTAKDKKFIEDEIDEMTKSEQISILKQRGLSAGRNATIRTKQILDSNPE